MFHTFFMLLCYYCFPYNLMVMCRSCRYLPSCMQAMSIFIYLLCIPVYGYLIVIKADARLNTESASCRSAGRTYSKRGPEYFGSIWQAFVIALLTMRPHHIQTHPLVIASPVYSEPLFRHQNLYINDGLQSLKRHGAWTGP